MATGIVPDEKTRTIQRLAKEQKIIVTEAPRSKLDLLTDGAAHQGVIAQMSPVKSLSEGELLELVKRHKTALSSQGPEALNGYTLVALDGIEDPRNVGAIIRAAEASGAKAVIIPERRASQITETVAKTSAGAIAHIPIARVTNLATTLNKLKELDIWIIGLAGEASQPINKFDMRRPMAIVIGSEGKGLRKLVRDGCDALVSIPMKGRTQSLNASVAAGIALYEATRQNS